MNNNRPSHVHILSFILLTGFLFTTPAGAEVYKWTDEHGRVHYGDKPGMNTAREIEIQEHTETRPDRGDINRRIKQQRLLQLFAEEREQKKQEKIDQANEKKKREEHCAKARNYRQSILSSSYLFEEDESGNRRILSEEEFEAELAQTEKIIEEYCT